MTPDPLTKLSACEWTAWGTGRACSQLTGCTKSYREKGEEGRPRTAPKPHSTKLTTLPRIPGPKRLSVGREEQKDIWKPADQEDICMQPPIQDKEGNHWGLGLSPSVSVLKSMERACSSAWDGRFQSA